MAVKEYSNQKDGGRALSANFKVREFVCRDGSDTVRIDSDLIVLLQRVRDHFARPVVIVSGYRTPAYNASVGGAKASQHMLGKAADIRIGQVKPRAVAEYCESLAPGGLGLYEYGGMNGFVHMDTRSGRARWLQTSPNGGAVSVSGFGKGDRPTLKSGAKGEAVKELQNKLNAAGCPCGAADGIFGPKTLAAVKQFQKASGLTADGIVGPKTWAKLG